MRPPGESSNDAEQAPQEEGAESRLLSPKEAALMQLELTAEGVNPFEYTGLKFEEPPMPTGKLHEAQYHMRFRYEEGIAQITRLLMRDGKLGKAQNVSHTIVFEIDNGPFSEESLGKRYMQSY